MAGRVRNALRSLQVRMTAITIAASLVTLVAFAFASFFTVGQEVNMSSAEHLHLVCDNLHDTLEVSMTDIKHCVEVASYISTDSLDAVTLVDCGAHLEPSQRTGAQQRALDAYLENHCDHVYRSFASVAGRTSSIITYYYCISPDVSANVHGFYYSKLGKVGFEEREPIDVSKLDPNNSDESGWYYTPIRRGFPVWVGPYHSPSLGNALIVSYLTPIYRSGTLIGVLGMDILFDTIIEQVAELEVYQTGYACLLDAQGRVLYHPELVMGAEPEFAEQIRSAGSIGQDSSGYELIRYEHKGETWQLSFTTLSNGMKLVATAPVQEIVASWRHLQAAVPAIALGILMLFVPITMVVMGALTKPLRQLTEATHRLSAGDYDVELDYHGSDEVGELTEAFRKMRDHLRMYISNLNSRSYVDALTGVKNDVAFDISAAKINDVIERTEGTDDPKFALAVFVCSDLEGINEAYGHDRGDIYLKTCCELIQKIFGRSEVFRMSADEFVVILQGRDYANRLELMQDFSIMASAQNARTSEHWQQVAVSTGLAKYRSVEDENVMSVLIRARSRTA